MSGPLDGIRIVDLSVAITGPLAAGMLVDQGADCVKVEQAPTGDVVRWLGSTVAGISAMFQAANRGKRSIVLDLAQADGLHHGPIDEEVLQRGIIKAAISELSAPELGVRAPGSFALRRLAELVELAALEGLPEMEPREAIGIIVRRQGDQAVDGPEIHFLRRIV